MLICPAASSTCPLGCLLGSSNSACPKLTSRLYFSDLFLSLSHLSTQIIYPSNVVVQAKALRILLMPLFPVHQETTVALFLKYIQIRPLFITPPLPPCSNPSSLP